MNIAPTDLERRIYFFVILLFEELVPRLESLILVFLSNSGGGQLNFIDFVRIFKLLNTLAF